MGSRRHLRKQVHTWGLPAAWVPIVLACLLATTCPDLDGVEVFAGAKELTFGCRHYGLAFETIEKEDGDDQDLLTDAGLRKAIRFICRTKEKGLLWLGVPCSSWVFIGRSNSGRSLWRPQGNESLPYTQLHNSLASVALSLARLAFCLGIYYVIEQPSTSVFWSWLPTMELLCETAAQRISFNLSAFGADTQKRLVLHGTAPWLRQLQDFAAARPSRPAQAESLVTTRVDPSGETKVTGKRKRLKESQAYTAQFGRKVGALQSRLDVKRRPVARPLFSLMDG